jgi:hypothetical protein
MGSEYHNEDFDVEAQQASRDAVMQIRLFPDLPRQLKKVLGFGPHVDMLQHYCHWMHPRHPKMQNRWSLWKTFEEWYDECGLTDRQVKRGRKILREKGIMTYKRGQYSRVYYSVDWVALADALGLEFIPDGNSVQYDDELNDEFDFSDDSIPDGNSVRLHSGRYSDQVIPDGNSVRLNTGDYSEDYLTEESTLQVVGAEPAKAEPAQLLINKDKEQKEQPPTTEHPSQNGHTQSESGLERERVEEVVAPPKPDDNSLLDDVREILDPEAGRWWGAKFIADRRKDYAPGAVVTIMLNSVEDIEEPVAITEADKTELLDAVRYVMWEAEEEVS